MQPPGDQQQPAGPMGRLVVVARCSWLNWPVRLFLRPQIGIDDTSTRGRWGANTFDLHEGQYNIYVVINWPLLRFGAAHAGATIVGDEETVLYYKTPIYRQRTPGLRGDSGVLDRDPGPHPERKEGMRFTIIFVVAIVAVVLLALTQYL